MFLMRFTKKISKKFANFFIEKNLQSLSIFRKSKNPEIFGKSKIDYISISIEKFQKSKIFTRKFQNFRKFSKIFWKSRKFIQLWRFFSTKNFANFLMNFFLNLIRNIWFIRIIEPFSTIPRCVYMRWHRVRLCFSLFLTTNHQKWFFFLRNSLLGLDPRLQPQNPTLIPGITITTGSGAISRSDFHFF